jgi:hypothetical protein
MSAPSPSRNPKTLNHKVITMKTIALLCVAGTLAIPQLVAGQSQVVLVEQAINFKLKLTTLTPPQVSLGGSGADVAVKLRAYSGTITTKDVLQTLGFSSSAALIAQLVADTNVRPAEVTQRILVRQGSAETDVTSILGKVVPSEDPISILNSSSFATGVLQGSMRASLTRGMVTASLNALTYEQGAAQLQNLQAGGIRVGSIDINAVGVSKATISLKATLDRLSLGLGTVTEVAGGATLSNPPIFSSLDSIPAIVQGTITTKGKNNLDTLGLIHLIDLSDLLGS